jgi:hypothetical protein
MTVSTSPQDSTRPIQAAPPPEAAREVRRGRSRLWLALPVVILFFAAMYAFAWFQASRLSARFAADADASYQQGEYLQALVGSEEFDEARNEYVTRGGYVQVERIWSHPNSWPIAPQVAAARERIDEIIGQHLTAEEAEDYIRANTGKPAPYFGEIYVRLGELYAQEGADRDAREIFESVPQLFGNRPDLVERAQNGLQALGPE